MRHFIILSLCLLLIAIAGCEPDIRISGFFGDPYYPSVIDSSGVSSVRLGLSADTVLYTPGSVAEVSGYADVRNYYGDWMRGIALDFCVSDSSVSLVWTDPTLRNTTDSTGHVHFTLRTTNSGGRVRVSVCSRLSVMCDADTLFFLRQDRQPTHVNVTAMPETLYVDWTHRDSTLIRIALLGGQSQAVPDFNVECALVGESFYHVCSHGFAQTNADGIASDYYFSPYDVSSPLTVCYRVRAGALMDSVCLTFMPWDSTHGG